MWDNLWGMRWRAWMADRAAQPEHDTPDDETGQRLALALRADLTLWERLVAEEPPVDDEDTQELPECQ